jgi:hypothetical protein
MKINNGYISVDLPSKLEDSDFYTDKPFVFFYNESFMEKSCYDNFISELNNLFKNANWEKDASGKKRFKFDPNYINDYNLDSTISDFIGIFSTKDFRNWFKQTHESFYDIGFLGSTFPKKKITKFILKIINKSTRMLFGLKAFNIYSTQVEFSKLGPGASIAPHTDSFTKRMALVFYTPLSKITSAMSSNWGTSFWQTRKGHEPTKSWKSNHMLDDKDLNDFMAKNEIVKSIHYTANKINGFIKSDISWHSVEKNTYSENRVAIVINIHDISSEEKDIKNLQKIQKQIQKTV